MTDLISQSYPVNSGSRHGRTVGAGKPGSAIEDMKTQALDRSVFPGASAIRSTACR
jgi:hypothetical protein